MTRLTYAVLVALATVTLLACPGSSGSSGSGHGTDTTRASSPWDPVTCPSTMSWGNCSADDLQDWADCELENCKTVLDTCYGPEYRAGIYEGSCAEFMECARKCTCANTACVAACPVSEACSTCLDTTPCDAPDACDLMCDLTPATPDKTCDDVKRCCAGLPEAQRASCVEHATYQQSASDGQAKCAGIYPFYALASSTCD